MPKPTRPSYSFEFKLAIVQRFIAGETALDLAREYDLSSPRLIQTWARAYRRDGEDALRPKPKGRARNGGERVGRRELSELEKLRSENARLEAENAYLKKLRALRAQGRQ
ncbi:helix-turn-helix domain-containing protein [Agromyces sp. Soil535]|uniref:helix-turn-helix domain-containing protein n=1 Tax=Agromyces sp. Soil535 TaxID=1736390 RepID=UPI000A8FAB30|nr:helix-turn-helix domain-containing protein [Agromyces sp. Soil535]